MSDIIRLFTIAGLMVLLSNITTAQFTDNLFTYYDFNQCSAEDAIGLFPGIPTEELSCVCGYEGQAVRFDGNQVIKMGAADAGLNNTISSDEFSLGIALLTSRSYGPMTVFSVTEDCDSYGFELVYNPSSGFFNLRIRSQTELVDIPFQHDAGACWQSIVINRIFNRIECVVNGELKVTKMFQLNPNFRSLGVPKIGGGGCAGISFGNFRGLIDEVRIYNRVLSATTASRLSSNSRNQLNDHFQVIFTGQSYGVEVDTDCQPIISWTPTDGVSDPTSTLVDLSPDVTTRYTVSATYEGCTQSDTIHIKVLDESSINCQQLLLPNSFTPNGDQLNDTYGISTTYAIEGDCRFEIFNMHGGRVFLTISPYGRWDGTFDGKDAPPGTYMYKIKYTCSGKEYSVAGSVNLIR